MQGGCQQKATSTERSVRETMRARVSMPSPRMTRVNSDGSPAVLVYRPVRGDTQVVDLFLCGRRDATRSITLPAP